MISLFVLLCFRLDNSNDNKKIADITEPPTNIPGTDKNYINKVFTTESQIDQIQIGEGNLKQLSGCHFKDIRNSRIYYLHVVSEALIFDNIFENTEYVTNQPGCFWYDRSVKISIDNCKFIRIAAKGVDGYVFNNDNNNAADVTFNDCKFIDCGEKKGGRPLINALDGRSSLKFYRCDFNFSDQATSVSILDLRSNDATFDNCRFVQCGPEAIYLCKDDNDFTFGTFKFTNNYVINNRGRFINGYNMQSRPIIRGNTFTEMTITENSFILIAHNQDEIELVDNTFSKFTVSGENELNGGGIASIFDKNNAEFTLKYTNCRFYDNNNKHNKSPSSQGGSLQIGFSNININININVAIEKCEFKRNKAIGHGGGISIRSAKSIVIRGSEFESNIANNEATSSRLLFDNHYSDKTHGFGGAIYLNPTFKLNDQDYYSTSITIEGCTFKNNRAYEGYAIYIEGEESSTTYSITNNKFINNYEGFHSPTNGGVIASEVHTITKETIESSNQFTAEEGYESTPFIHVDHKGNRLPNATIPPTYLPEYSYDDKNPIDPDKGRIEKVMNPNNEEEKNVKVVVTVSEFNKNTNDDGGAIHLINCGLECTKTKFTECASENGGGGGIYIKNTEESLNNVNINGLEFTKCRAQYGGGVYIYSKY